MLIIMTFMPQRCAELLYTMAPHLRRPASPWPKKRLAKCLITIMSFFHCWRTGVLESLTPTPYTIFSLGQGWGRGGRHVAQNLINIIVTSQQAQRDLQARGVLRRLPSEELNNVPDPFDVYEETHLDTLADIQLEQPQGNQRFELPGRFNLPQY